MHGQEVLCVGVRGVHLGTRDTFLHHAVYGIASGTTNADNLDIGPQRFEDLLQLCVVSSRTLIAGRGWWFLGGAA
jgi:hypothetical protein